ncbi:DUF2953 domain-containing protein [Methanolobus sp. ZRKC5]|uniref:DUF2953 domain-containing protein n=1 Tax=unclassified Methanolobus TaxID=2629569 RepID=UPI00313C47DA
MLSVLMVILLLIVLVVLVFLLILFTAIDIVFEAQGSGSDIEHRVSVHWLLFSYCISPTDDKENEFGSKGDQYSSISGVDVPEGKGLDKKTVKREVKGGKKEPSKSKKSKDISFSEILQAFRQLRSPAIRLLQGTIHAIRIPYARVNMVFGFPDPAYTGIACGYVHALKGYFACHSDNLKMQLEPDFIDSRLDFDMKGSVRIRLYRFILVILFFVLDRNVLRFSWQFFINRYSKKSSVNL